MSFPDCVVSWMTNSCVLVKYFNGAVMEGVQICDGNMTGPVML